jgi:hypothetical protein
MHEPSPRAASTSPESEFAAMAPTPILIRDRRGVGGGAAGLILGLLVVGGRRRSSRGTRRSRPTSTMSGPVRDPERWAPATPFTSPRWDGGCLIKMSCRPSGSSTQTPTRWPPPRRTSTSRCSGCSGCSPVGRSIARRYRGDRSGTTRGRARPCGSVRPRGESPWEVTTASRWPRVCRDRRDGPPRRPGRRCRLRRGGPCGAPPCGGRSAMRSKPPVALMPCSECATRRIEASHSAWPEPLSGSSRAASGPGGPPWSRPGTARGTPTSPPGAFQTPVSRLPLAWSADS